MVAVASRQETFERHLRPLTSEVLLRIQEWLLEAREYELAGLPAMLDKDSLKDAHQTKGRIEWLAKRAAEIQQEVERRSGKPR